VEQLITPTIDAGWDVGGSVTSSRSTAGAAFRPEEPQAARANAIAIARISASAFLFMLLSSCLLV
jgi:hypothetical protein